MSIVKLTPAFFLGSNLTNPKVLGSKVDEVIDVVNGITAGTTTLTDVEVGNGTAAVPTMTFASDLDTGIYRVGTNDLGISAGGTLRVDVSSTAVTSAIPVVVSSTTDATTSTTGSVKTAGGMGIAKALYVGTSVNAATYVTSGNGTVSLPAIGPVSDVDTGFYFDGSNAINAASGGAKAFGIPSTAGIQANGVTAITNLGTTPVGTVSIVENTDGRRVTATLTLTGFIVGALAGAGAALGMGNIVYALPAGVQLFEVSYLSIALTAAGTAVTPKLGLGSVIGSGAVSVLNGTSTFMDYHTEFTGGSTSTHAVVVDGPVAATAGYATGISLQTAAKIKNLFLNAAGTWNADNTGNLTATGTIVLTWDKLA